MSKEDNYAEGGNHYNRPAYIVSSRQISHQVCVAEEVNEEDQSCEFTRQWNSLILFCLQRSQQSGKRNQEKGAEMNKVELDQRISLCKCDDRTKCESPYN